MENKLDLVPDNSFVTPMLTDMYQLSMAYAYWKAGRHNLSSVFDLFFRKNPFKGEFTIFAGLEQCIKFIASFKYTDADLAHLRTTCPHWEQGFFDYLKALNPKDIKLYAINEGTIVFPRTPLLRIEGPLAFVQLLETTLLVLVNYASLVTTNAARHRFAAGRDKLLMEFGLRRAQGPDGAMSASKYAVMGGFDSTSNVKAGQLYDVPVVGTHAHSFVSSFCSLSDVQVHTMKTSKGEEKDFVKTTLKYREELKCLQSNLGELAAFICYAQAYPGGFLALIDTYDTLSSGIWNFLCVSLALAEFGYKPKGIRLDSGDLAYLSRQCRQLFIMVSQRYKVEFEHLNIVASNDLSEDVLISLNTQGHSIDTFGIGTHLVTCKSQPALGCVFKLVEANKEPRIKISQDVEKVTIPGRKEVYRLYNAAGYAVVDLMCTLGSPVPKVGKKILARHPFDQKKRVYVIPSKVEPLHQLWWDGKLCFDLPSLKELQSRVKSQLSTLRDDHQRSVNPTPYKVSVSSDLYTFMQDLLLSEMPIPEIC